MKIFKWLSFSFIAIGGLFLMAMSFVSLGGSKERDKRLDVLPALKDGDS